MLAASGRPWVWFDGAAAAPGEPRVSYLGVASELRIAETGLEREFLAGLRAAPGAAAVTTAVPGLQSGWAVALAYEFGVALLDPVAGGDLGDGGRGGGGRPTGIGGAADGDCDEGPAGAPGFALRLDGVLAIDHDRGAVEPRGDTSELAALLGPASLGSGPYLGPESPDCSEASASSETSAGSERSAGSKATAVPAAAGSDRAARPGPSAAAPRWRRTDAAYAAEVEACRSAIRDGEAYVLCLTDTAEMRGDFDPLELFLRLRAGGGAVRGGVIVAGDRALVSASPERFLSARGRRILTHPIKGTRPRGATPDADAALAAQLASDPKERAENLMIVDLMRNDLSRVCEVGSVGVEGFLRVETHPHVHQLVSTVGGELRAGRDVFDAIETCFPGGSMTGAPKRRAVEILRQLEGAPRGLYSGCFGWVGDGGDAELAMTIRSVELRAGGAGPGAARIGAGGGVTADSDPERETAEKHLKAAPLLAALAPREPRSR